MKTFHNFTKYLLTLLFCSLTISIISAPAFSEEPYVFERMWPTLQQPWYFNGASGIETDPDGNVYIVDRWFNRIQKFSSDGVFITKWGSEGSGNGQFYYPVGIAIDINGNLYVTDTYNFRIQKFTSDGTFITKWGSYGSDNGEFIAPEGISIDSNGNVYVADTENNRIQKFDSDGNFTTKWGTMGAGDGEFNKPTGIAVDASGNVYVADTGNNRIQKFDSDGNYITKWGAEGTGEGEFDTPKGTDIDANGNIYVADYENYRIQKFEPDGTYITEISTKILISLNHYVWYHPVDLAIQEPDKVYFSTSNAIIKLNTDGTFINSWEALSKEESGVQDPDGIAIDNNGNITVVDRVAGSIKTFEPDGDFITEWGERGSDDGKFYNPSGIAINSAGDVYVTDDYGKHIVHKFTSSGVFINEWGGEGSEDGQFIDPDEIAIGENGNVYVADSGNHRIQKFDSNGNFIRKWGTEGTGNGQFDEPEGIAVDASGNVYVADTGNNRVQKFDSNGTFIMKWGSYGSEDGHFSYPHGIALDEDGNVYVADSLNERIQKFSPDGTLITKFGESGSEPGMFGMPLALCVDSSGRVFTTDSVNNRVQVFAPESLVVDPEDDSDEDPETVPKAIIVAGGGPFPGNNLWNATQMCATYAYRALIYQGYTKDRIYYLSADIDLDLDGNGVLDDVDGAATNSNLEYAITTWAQDAEDLFIYMVDHGGLGTFRMGATELLNAGDLDSWLDEIQDTIPGNVTLLYDACQSGSFLPLLTPPEGKERIIAASASSDGEALFGAQGTISFSFFFWGRMFNGDSFYDSYVSAKNGVYMTYSQTPQIEANGNGIGNETEDKNLAMALKIGNETLSAGDIPFIGSVSSGQTLDSGNTSALIWADNVIDANGISRVWAVITPPDYSSGSPDSPVTDLPILELPSAGGNRYEGTYNDFSSYGNYSIAVFAMDAYGNVSLPKNTFVYQETGIDLYEDDDSPDSANIIICQLGWDEMYDILTQRHNFHDAGDEDWVKFYGIEDESYEITTENLGTNCDTVIMLYDENGDPKLIEPLNDYGYGHDELLSWQCPADGIYYIMVKQADPADYGQDTGYDLKLYQPKGGTPGWLVGIVVNSLGQGIGDAVIKSDATNITTITNESGLYIMALPSGTHTITASASGYDQKIATGVEVTAHGEATRNFELYNMDSDDDGLYDNIEAILGTDPYDADTDDDGILDGDEDEDHDGVVDANETNPTKLDTDGDGIQDGTELGYILAHIGEDTDTDIFQPDLDPSTWTNPLKADTDNDGKMDGQEDINHNGKVDEGESDPTEEEFPWELFMPAIMKK